MSALSRRTTGASAATLVPVLTVSAAAPSDTTLLALESRWLAACAEEKRLHDEWRAIYDSLPTKTRDGFPTIPTDGAGGLFLLHQWGKRISLRELRAFNEACIYDDQYAWGKSPARLARIRAECRERVRWWIASRRDIKRQEEATGIVEANERDEEAYKITSGIEDQILAAPAAGIEGLRVKLAVLARMSFTQFSDADGNSLPDEEWDATDLAVMKLHAEAEWIAGRAKA
jgi:hypothetical protein